MTAEEMLSSVIPPGGFWYGWNEFFTWIVSLIPTITLPTGSETIFSSAAVYTRVASYYVPVDVLLVCIITVLGFWLACLVISALLQLL